MRQFFHFDAADSAFLEKELEHVMAQTFEKVFPELKARSFIPTTSEAGAGATSVAYDIFGKTGQAKIVGSSPGDIPRVEVDGTRFSRPVRDISLSYAWTIKEIRSAALAGRNLNSRKAMATREGIEEKIDEVASLGAPDYGIPTGFLNDANVAVTAAGAGQDWSTLLGAGNGTAVIKQISDALGRIIGSSKGAHRPDTLLIPEDNFALASTTPWSTGSDKTVLDFIRGSFTGLTVEPWYRLDTAGAGSVSRMVMYKRSETVLSQEIPLDFEQLPPQEVGLEVVVPAWASTAGTVIVQPTACDYLDGI